MSDPLASLVGVEYTDGGRTIEGGLDCYGLVRLALRRLGVDLPASEAGLAFETAGAEPVPLACVRRGDVVVMPADEESAYAVHLGVMVDPLRLLHAVRGVGSRIDRYEAWCKAGKVTGVYRFGGGR